mmetsp:Transcript_14001/g.21848  ORF Transcript_14001/g.21848 Transcript_14001/m.21848 type:complete len:213 (+) Transcript_14001:2747-3385(+)
MTAFVNLTAHENGSEFDNVGFKSHISSSLGSFETKKTTTNNGSRLHIVVLGILEHSFEIFNGTVDENSGTLASRNWRDEWKRSSCHDSNIVGNLLAGCARNSLGFGINSSCLVSQEKFNSIFVVPCSSTIVIEIRSHGQSGGIASFKIRSELYAIVGSAGFFAKGRNGAFAFCVKLEHLLHESLANHTVTDHDNAFFFFGHRQTRPCAKRRR